MVKSFANQSWTSEEQAVLDISIPTDCGRLLLKKCEVLGITTTITKWIRRCTYKTLGYDQQELLAQAQRLYPIDV